MLERVVSTVDWERGVSTKDHKVTWQRSVGIKVYSLSRSKFCLFLGLPPEDVSKFSLDYFPESRLKVLLYYSFKTLCKCSTKEFQGFLIGFVLPMTFVGWVLSMNPFLYPVWLIYSQGHRYVGSTWRRVRCNTVDPSGCRWVGGIYRSRLVIIVFLRRDLERKELNTGVVKDLRVSHMKTYVAYTTGDTLQELRFCNKLHSVRRRGRVKGTE